MGEYYGIPGEFEKHLGTIAMYPLRTDIWRDEAKHMQKYTIDLVNTIAAFEQVFLFCYSNCVSDVKKQIDSSVKLISCDYDDIWSRDIAPTFIRTPDGMKCIDWRFNAWGGKKEGSYFPWNKDDVFASFVADYFGLECIRSKIIAEGGAIISDGQGTVFSTRSVLMNRNRNAGKGTTFVTNEILTLTGSRQLVWLKQGLYADETNGHIDNLISLIDKNEICLAWTDDSKDPNYKRVRFAQEILEHTKDVHGNRYKIHHIPLPDPLYMTNTESKGLFNSADSLDRNEGDLLPASYLNFYMVNDAVLIPSFGCEEDELVKQIMCKLFKGKREVVPVFSREPLLGGGGLHCILHEIPEF